MEYQPSPDIGTPGTSDPRRSQSFWRFIRWTGLVAVLLLLVAPLSIPPVIRGMQENRRVRAYGNARHLGLALYEFKTEYGKLPDFDTIETVSANSGTTLSLGTKTSNDIFRQLVASGIATSESIFQVEASGARKPDNVMSGDRALEKGEVGLSYVSGLEAAGDPSRPLIVAPLIPGTDSFDPKPFGGKALVMTVDERFYLVDIDRNGHVVRDGMNLLDPKHPVWGGGKWKLLWPE